MSINFSFTRNPSTKISIDIEAFGLIPPDNEVVLIGKRAGPVAPAVKEEGTIDFAALVAINLDGTGFNLPDGVGVTSNGVAFWFDIDDSGTTIPAFASAIVTAGGRAIEITTVNTGDSDAVQAQKVAAVILADSAFDIGSDAGSIVSYRLAVATDVADGVDGAQATGAVFAVTVQGADVVTTGSAVTEVPIQIENVGDDILALTEEVNGLFGSGSEISEMVIAAVEAVLFSDLDPILLSPIKAIPLAFSETLIAPALAANISLPMPFVAMSFPLTDSVNRDAFKDHLVAISKSDRPEVGQFGSFGFMHTDGELGTVTPIAEAIARQEVVIPWLRDAEGTPANKSHEVAAASCMLVAANIVPFNPVNSLKLGKLDAPANKSDHHTPGDAGTIAVGLEAGLMPLFTDDGGNVRISRSVTASRRVAGVADNAYFDVQDWQVLYLFRKNAFNISQQKVFKRAKGTVQKARALKRELLAVAKTMETLEMLQFVEQLANEFTFRRASDNRHAFIFEVPLNVVPGFHNKGIGLIGTTKFDLLTI